MALSSRELFLVLRLRDEASRMISGFSGSLARAGSEAERQRAALGRSIMQTGAAVATLGIGMIAVGVGIADALYKAANFSKEYQRQVALTKTQTDGFAASLSQISEIGLRVANTVPVAFEKIQPALYDIFSSTNANLAQAETLLTNFSKAAVAGQTEIQKASRGTITIMNAYHIPFESVSKVLDVQFQLVRKGVGTYEEFSTVYGRIVPSAQRAGQNFETVAAMLALMTRNGLSAAMAATSGARALDAFSNPVTVGRLEAMGVKVRDLQGNFLPLVDILQGLQDKLKGMTKPEIATALQALFKGSGGTIQARRFIDMVLQPGQLEQFKGFLGDMVGSTGQFEKAYATMADTTASKTLLLSNQWKVLKERIGEFVTPYLEKAVEWLGKLLGKFNDLDPVIQKGIVNFGILLSAGLILGGGLLVIVGSFAMLVGAIISLGTEFLIIVGIIAAVIAIFVGLGTAIINLWQESGVFRLMIKGIGDDAMAMWRDSILPAFRGAKKAYDDHLKPAFENLWQVIEQHIIPLLDVLRRKFDSEISQQVKEVSKEIIRLAKDGFKFLADLINNYLIPALEQATRFYYDHKKAIDEVIHYMVIIIGWIIKFGAIAALVFGGTVGVIVVSAIISFIAFVITAINQIMFWITVIKTVWGWLSNLGDMLISLAKKISGAKDAVGDFLSSVPSRISALFSDAGNWLYNAGANIVQGLIDGLRSKIGTISSVAGTIASTVRGFFPFSPAKVGPLSGQGDPFIAGGNIASRLASGMIAQSGAVQRASNTLAAQFTYQAPNASPFNTGDATRRGRQDSPVDSRRSPGASTIVNNMYVTTPVTDPKALAAEMGWQIQNRLGV